VIALVTLACLGLLWWVFTSDSGGATPTPGEKSLGADTAIDPGGGGAPTGATGAAPSLASTFPLPAEGDRLELGVLSLGDHPNRCQAVSLLVDGEVRTAFHHRCAGRSEDLSFFLVRLTGSDAEPVAVHLGGFALVTEDGRTLEPLDLQDVNRRFPETIALGPDVSRKGWVVFEAPGVPVSLRYADQDQVLVVRFPDTWL
jgi:hypothetical protein